MNPNHDKDKLWVAYLDGQLSAAEALAFEATLSSQERALCAQEIRFEGALGESLRESAPPCPEAAWRKTLDDVALSSGRKSSWLSRPFIAVPTFLGFAAAMVLTFQTVPTSAKVVDPILYLPGSVQELEKTSGTGASVASVQDFLNQRDVRLAVADVSGAALNGHHDIRLLGASERGCRGHSVIEVLFECCNEPVKVLIAERGTKADRILRHACGLENVQHLREMEGYVAAVVSLHHSPDLTVLFSEPEKRLARMTI